MSQLVTDAQFEMFKGLMASAADTFAQQTITWRRRTSTLQRFKEDDTNKTADVELKCLCNYNYLRSWPITNNKESGEINAQSVQVLFGKQYLKDLGYLDNDGKFIYNQDYDRFILDGTIRKPVGDTGVSQVFDEAVWVSVIMVEQPTATGDKRD